MRGKYQNKYRIKSHRKPNWDYDRHGAYFITICTQKMKCILGKIINAADGPAYMEPSDFGKIVDTEWQKSFDIRHELSCDEYIIMPNHIHAILIIDNVQTHGLANAQTHGRANVQTHGRASLPSPKKIPSPKTKKIPSPKTIPSPDYSPMPYRLPKSISSFLAGFKSAVNSKIDDYIDKHQLKIPKYNRNNHFFQPNYHDHIIRNETEYERIKNYIINNPANWKGDNFNK